jgi:hypothetical protein
MAYEETTTTSFGSKLKNSIAGLGTGLLLIIGSPVLLFWNESNFVDAQKALVEFGKSMVSISDLTKVDSAASGKPIYIRGEAAAGAPITDFELAITAKAIKIDRSVQMFQWKENKTEKEEKQIGGSTVTKTTYTYTQEWSSSFIDSSKFNQNAVLDYYNTNKVRPVNPAAIGLKSDITTAKDVKMGAYNLSEPMVSKISANDPLEATPAMINNLPAGLRSNAKIDKQNVIYIGSNPSSPVVGDQKITLKQAKSPILVSIIGALDVSNVVPFKGGSGSVIARVSIGEVSAQKMQAEQTSENKFIIWLLRLVGFLMMFFGIKMLFKPLVKLAEVLPFLSSIISFGASLIAAIIAIPFCLIVIAIAWIIFRPLVGIILLLVAGGAGYGIYYWKKKKGAILAKV